MPIASETGFTRQEMILVHLMRFGATKMDCMEMPFSTTCYGISVSLGISRQHVNKELRILEGKGQVTHRRANISGNGCKMNAYILEREGMERALEADRRNPDAIHGIIFTEETVNVRKARSEINEALRILDDGGESDRIVANNVVTRLSAAIGFLLKEVA